MLISAQKPAKYSLRILSLLWFVVLAACGSHNASVTTQSNNNSGIAIPQAISTVLPTDGVLYAYLRVDGGARHAMTIIKGIASITLDGLSLGQHTFTIEFEYAFVNKIDTPFMLASASLQMDVVGSSNKLDFKDTPYDTSYDYDQDSISNLDELANGTDPLTVNIPGNAPPVANNVNISDDNQGLLIPSTILTGNYTYYDTENDPKGVPVTQWLRNNVAITGATTSTYTLTNADVGQQITFEITPVATTGTLTGTAVDSAVTPVGPVQVANDNAAGHDAAGPSIAVDANGNAIAVWQQFEPDSDPASTTTVEMIYASHYDAITGWGQPVQLETDNAPGHSAFNPQIAMDANGNAMAVWNQYEPDSDLSTSAKVLMIYANRYDAITGWGQPVKLETDNAPGHDAVGPEIAFDANGNAMAVWTQYEPDSDTTTTATVSMVYANHYDAITGWGQPVQLETDNAPGHNVIRLHIAVDVSGNAMAVWDQYEDDTAGGTVDMIYANRYDATLATPAWGTPVLLETDNTVGRNATYPQIAVDASGNAIAIWEQVEPDADTTTTGTVTMIYANRYDASATTPSWGTPAQVESDNAPLHNALTPEIAFDINGNAMAVWSQGVPNSDGSGVSLVIYARRYDATAGWAQLFKVGTDNFKFHRADYPYIAFNANGNAIAVWQHSTFQDTGGAGGSPAPDVTSVFASRYNANATTPFWSPPFHVSDNTPGQSVGGSQIIFDANGNALAGWSHGISNSDGTGTGIVSSIFALHF